MNRTLALGLLVSAALIQACGDSSTGPGGSGAGTVQVFAKDDPATLSGDRTASGLLLDRQGTANASGVNGSLSGEMSVAIQTDAGAWVDVGSPSSVTVVAQSADSSDVSGSASVPVGTYAKVRIVWHHATAHLLAGSIIGGITLNADALVDIGGPDSVVIEKSVTPFTVEASASAHTQIVVDLNSEAWLTAQSVQAQTCSQASVDAAVTAVARVSGG